MPHKRVTGGRGEVRHRHRLPLLLAATAITGVALVAGCTTVGPGTIEPYAGTGNAGSTDGGRTAGAEFVYPWDLAYDATGNLYLTDRSAGRIRKITPAGDVTTIAGGGTDRAGDGGPATAAELYSPSGIGVDGAGDVFFIEDHPEFDLLRKVSTSGILSTVAGVDCRPWRTPPPGCSPSAHAEGGPAVDAYLPVLLDVLPRQDGSLLLGGPDRVWRVGTDGILTTVAGGGSDTSGADGLPATDVALKWPLGLIDDGAGGYYMATTPGIRHVTAEGRISTIAGGGTVPADNGVRAKDADLLEVSAIAFDRSGRLYIAGYRIGILRVSADGVLSRIAGNGHQGSKGDGGPATGASVEPFGLLVDGGDNVIFSEPQYHRLRQIIAPMP